MGIDSYIARQALVTALIVVVSLTGIIWLSQSLRFVDIIVNHGLPLTTFLHLTSLLMPTWLSIVLPIAAFTAVLYTYNRMAGDRELVVLAASGVSPFRLAGAGIAVAVLVTAFCYLMTLYLVPVSFRAFKELQFKIRQSYADIALREGVFNMIGNGITVHVRSHRSNGELKGMIVHDGRDAEEDITLIAESGALVMTDKGPLVFMKNGSRQSRDTKSGQVNLLYFDQYTVDLSKESPSTERLWRDQNELFLPDLLNPSPTLTSARHVNEYVAEGHYRLSAPLLGLALPLIGLAVLLCSEFSRRGLAWRILLAVALAAVVEVGGLGSKFLVIRQPWLLPLMYGVVLIPIAVSLFLLLRPDLLRRSLPSIVIRKS